jgi:hypothetical protein
MLDSLDPVDQVEGGHDGAATARLGPTTAAAEPTSPASMGPSPPAQPPTPPRHWYRRPWVIILGVLGVLLVIGMLTSDPQPTTQPATTAAPTPQANATTPAATKPPATDPAEGAPGIGERARDGKFEFVVSRVRCGVDRIGSQYLNKRPRASSA